MLAKLFGWLSADAAVKPAPGPLSSADGLLQPDLPAFSIAPYLETKHGFPVVDWRAVHAWLEGVAPSRRAEAWTACEREWMMHFGAALGGSFRLDEGPTAMLVTELPVHVARATLEFMSRSIYYPEHGEFAFSSGMHIHSGCSHFVTVGKDLHRVEPVIAHEMTHGLLSHLPIPAWLNEGLAVNVERRLTGVPPSLYTPERMHERQIAFWSPERIQEFWSGKAFLRSDEGCELSYDLARILVEHLSRDWDRFQRFANAAQASDGGAAAARLALGVELGDLAAAIFDEHNGPRWAPDPARWEGEPERGAF